jgi:DNA-binding transcriptional ArsR family regulator
MAFEIKRRGKLLDGGLPNQLADWFTTEGRSGEFLSASDVAVKFGVTLRYARNALSKLRQAGLVERETVWRFRSKTNDKG